MRVVNAQQMKRIDERTTASFGIPSIVLMENAARAAVDYLEKRFPEAERIAIFCGPGQNGGDGLAMARHLHNRGRSVQVMLLFPSRLHGDAKTNLDICRLLELALLEVEDENTLEKALVRTLDCDLIVDAIFGTGLDRQPEGVLAEAIESLSTLRIPVLSIDLPSGLRASSGEVAHPVVQADATVTFALPKVAHLFEPASSFCGDLFVAEISIPHAAIDAENVSLELLGRDVVWPFFSERDSDSHKGSNGHVVIIGGSSGRSGAAILASRGALRFGAGLVTVVTDAETARLVHGASIETMTRSASKVDDYLESMDGKNAALIGPGLADDESAYAITREIVTRCSIASVVDASALNAFRGALAGLRTSQPRVLTPHPGELSRLTGIETSEINRDRLSAVRKAALESGCVTVLKGHRTLIAAPDGRMAINPTGNAAMAVGGTGDVLGGMVAALLARKIDAFDAACVATYIHGLAGDLLRDARGEIGMLASELADAIPQAIARVHQ